MSRRQTSSRSSSVYSQDSGRGRTNQPVVVGGMPRTASPGAIEYARNPPPSRFSVSTTSSAGSNDGARRSSSRYSGSPGPGSSGPGAPSVGRPPSSGYSAAARPSSSGSGTGGGSRPGTPAHASIMSAYGHSSYGRNTDSLGTFIQSDTQTSAARGPPPPSGTSYSKTFIDSSPQVGPPRGPSSVGSGSSSAGATGGSRDSAARAAERQRVLDDQAFMSRVPGPDYDLLSAAGKRSRGRRNQGRRDREDDTEGRR